MIHDGCVYLQAIATFTLLPHHIEHTVHQLSSCNILVRKLYQKSKVRDQKSYVISVANHISWIINWHYKSIKDNPLTPQISIQKLWISEQRSLLMYHKFSPLLHPCLFSYVFLLHTFCVPFPCHLHNFQQFLSTYHKTESACHESLERFSSIVLPTLSVAHSSCLLFHSFVNWTLPFL